MKKGMLKATTLLIAGVLCFGAVSTVPASAQVSSVTVTNDEKISNTNELPSVEKLNADLGFVPKFVEKFKNGYNFNSYDYFDRTMQDDGKIISKTTGVHFNYKKDKSNAMVMVNNSSPESIDMNDEILGLIKMQLSLYGGDATRYNGVPIIVTKSETRKVPEGYTPTAEEQKLIDEGYLTLFSGDNNVEGKDTCVLWNQDNLEYTMVILNNDEINAQDAIELAKEIIDKQ